MTDWQTGDLAWCIKDVEWRNEQRQRLAGPKVCSCHRVEAVTHGTTASGNFAVGLRFEPWPQFFNQMYFRKVTPPKKESEISYKGRLTIKEPVA